MTIDDAICGFDNEPSSFILEPLDEGEDLDREDVEDCCFPATCCMPGPHFRSECHTAEMLEAINAEEDVLSHEVNGTPVIYTEEQRHRDKGRV